jgi:hypothetical protein
MVPMQVTLAALADYVNNTPDNKLNIMGIFNTLRAAQFPAVIHEMRLIVKFQFTPAERGKTRMVQFKLLDPDGAELLSFTQPIHVPDNVLSPEVAHVANLRGIPVPRAGAYSFHVLMDDDDKVAIPLQVVQDSNVQGR